MLTITICYAVEEWGLGAKVDRCIDCCRASGRLTFSLASGSFTGCISPYQNYFTCQLLSNISLHVDQLFSLIPFSASLLPCLLDCFVSQLPTLSFGKLFFTTDRDKKQMKLAESETFERTVKSLSLSLQE